MFLPLDKITIGSIMSEWLLTNKSYSGPKTLSRPIAKKDAITRAALELFVEKGIDGTTTRDIALKAEAGEGTMFRHYPSKEHLAWDLYDRNLRSFLLSLEEAVAPHPTFVDRLRAMTGCCYELYETDPILCTYLLLTEHSIARHMPEDYRTPIALLVEILEEGQSKGEVEPGDTQLQAALLFGALLRVPLFKHYKRIQTDLRELSAPMAEQVYRMVQPERNPS